jgi:hypothetical protein
VVVAHDAHDTHDQLDDALDTSGVIGATRVVPKDNDEPRRAERQLRDAVHKLEHIGALMDALQHELESIGPWLAHPAAQRIMGAGIIGLVIKAEVLSSALKRFALRLRHNEVQQRLPPEGRDA